MNTNRSMYEAKVREDLHVMTRDQWEKKYPNAAKEMEEEAEAFASYRKEEESKKFVVKDRFGFSRYSTLAEAEAFAATLKNATIVNTEA